MLFGGASSAHIERRHNFHVGDVIAAEDDIHQAWRCRGGVRILVVRDSLDKRGSAVPHPEDSNPYRFSACWDQACLLRNAAPAMLRAGATKLPTGTRRRSYVPVRPIN